MIRFPHSNLILPLSILDDPDGSNFHILTRIYEIMEHDMIASRPTYLMADELPLPRRGRINSAGFYDGYFWCYFSVFAKVVFIEYHDGRGKIHLSNLLDRFKGHLQVDGYGIYETFDGQEGITLLNCMRHALEKFKDARSTDPFKAAIAIHFFDKLYEVESYCMANDLGKEFRKTLRRQISAPAFRNLAKWVESELHDLQEGENSLGIALKYFNKREKQLSVFLDDGLLYIDTDHLENIIKRISLSWKHHPARNVKIPGQTTAILYSLMITCELHGVDPYAWLKDISLLDPRFPLEQVNQLLPYNLVTNKV